MIMARVDEVVIWGARPIVERLAGHHDADPARHAAQIARELKPAMERLRETGDALEAVVAADLWPLPYYRTLLFLK